MSTLLTQLSGDCTFRDTRRGSADFCGAFFPELSGPQPPAADFGRGSWAGELHKARQRQTRSQA